MQCVYVCEVQKLNVCLFGHIQELLSKYKDNQNTKPESNQKTELEEKVL